MAESFIERRKRELSESQDASPSVHGIPDNLSYPERRRRELGLSNEKTPNMIHSDENKQYADAMKSAYESNPDAFTNPTNAPEPKKKIPILDFLNDKFGGVVEGISNFGNRSAANYVNDATLKTSTNYLRNNPDKLVTPIFQDNISPADTAVEKAADMFGSLAGFAIPAAGAYATGGKLAAMGLSKLAPNAPKIVQNLVRGIGAGTAYGTAREGLDAVINPDDKTALQRVGSVGLDAAMFGAGDAALPFVGAGLSAIGKKIAGSKLGDAVGNFLSRNKVTVQESPQQTLTLPPASPESIAAFNKRNGNVLPPNTDPIYGTGNVETLALPQGNYVKPTRLKVMNGEDAFNSVAPKVFQKATERMTPPMENPNELAKWVQGHLNDAGHNVSLNEVRKLSYEDMLHLADEMKPRINVSETVRNTAHEMGYGKIFDQTTPTVKERLANDLHDQVYGVPAQKLNIAKPDSFNITHENPVASPVNKVGVAQSKVKINNKPTEVNSANSTMENTLLKTDSPIAVEKGTYGITKVNVPEATQETITSTPVVKAPNKPTQPVKQSWFSSLFGEQNLGITPFASKNSGRMVSTEQQIVNSPIKNNLNGIVESTKQASRAGYQNTVDFLSSLKTISKEAYDTAMDASRAKNIANTIVHDKFVDNEGNVIGDSLNDIMKNVRGLGKKFDDYLILRHAETRMGRNEEVYDKSLNMTVEKVAEKIAVMEKRYSGLKDVGEQWDKFNGNMLDSGVKEGLLTPELMEVFRTESPHYASNRRQFTLGEKLAQPKFGSGGSSFSGQHAPIKSVSPTGSTKKIVSPIRSAIEQVYAWKNAELRNRTMQEIIKRVQLNPEAMKGIVEIVKKPSTSYKSLDDALREGGSEEFLQQLDNDFKSLFKPVKTGEENIVRGMVKGKEVFVKVNNPEAVKALLGLGSEQSGIVLAVMQKLSNATKRGATGLLAPMFAVKSLSMDVVQAAIQSPNAVKHVAVDLPHAIISSIGDILKIPGLKNLAEDFRRSGGEYSALLQGERGLKKSVWELRKAAPFSAEGIVKGSVATVKAPFKALEKVADVSENVNRIAAFRRYMLGKERTPENIRNAINAAREATTNFSRKGAYSKEVESVAPYSNSAVQGLYRVYIAFSNPKTAVKTIAGVSALVLVPKLIEYAKFNNDSDYQKIPARERYRNIIISKNKNGTFNKQPMPPEYLAFGAFMTDVLNDVINNDPQAYKGTLDSLANSFTPPLVSGALQGLTQGGGVEKSLVGIANATVAAPFVATIANQSFTGAPIVPQRLDGYSAEFQSDERTSKLAKTIGTNINLAPLKVDYLLRAYGGDPARLILPLTSDSGAGMSKETLLKNFILDPVITNTLSTDFYDAKTKYIKANNDYNDFNKPLPEWFDFGIYNYINSTKKGSISKTLSYLGELKRALQVDKTLSAKEKSKQIRDIQAEMNSIYTDANTELLKLGYKFPNR